MKQIITLFAMLTALTASAQQNPHIIASGTHFADGVKDKSWKNSNGPDFTKADFKAYSGETYVTIRVTEETDVLFSFNIRLTGGSLEVSLTDEAGRVEQLAYAEGKAVANTNEKRHTLQPGTEYRLRFNGRNAKGTYFCKWLEL